jgi:hypothetical protein
MGTIYLLHFDQPYKHARHYLGYTDDLPTRIIMHTLGQAARLTQVLKEQGISFRLARTWPGDRRFERRLHNRYNSPRLCPICKLERRKGRHE